MDVNRTPFLLLAEADDFAVADGSGLAWRGERRCLALDSAEAPRLAAGADAPEAVADEVLDRHGQRARIAEDGLSVEAAAGGWIQPLRDRHGEAVTPLAGRFSHIALGGDRLALALDGDTPGVQLFDLRRREAPRWGLEAVTLDEPVEALAVSPEGRVWAATAGRLIGLAGAPLPLPYHPDPASFEPSRVEPRPLRAAVDAERPRGSVVAMAADERRVHLLYRHANAAQEVVTFGLTGEEGGHFRIHHLAEGLPLFTDLALLDGRPVLLYPPASAQADAAVVTLHWAEGVGEARLAAERRPLLAPAVPRFYRGDHTPPAYPTAEGPRALHRLPQARYRARAALACPPQDCGTPGETWHRLYLEGVIPSGCAVELWARAGDHPSGLSVATAERIDRSLAEEGVDAAERAARIASIGAETRAAIDALLTEGREPEAGAVAERLERPGWIAELVREELAADPLHRQPTPVWNPLPSELPWHPGLTASKRGESGLFETLLQRAGGNVRRLEGRWLQLHLVLSGDGRRTPAIHAVRLYAPRFCYQERYLPPHLRQQERWRPLGEPANGSDLRERYFAALEGMLTPIEGRAVAAELLLDPLACPEPLLPGLAALLGLDVSPRQPEARRRRRIAEAGELMRRHGTLEGVRLALDVATDGGVARGEVVVVENFRLRRTMATLLGIEMEDERHPLTLGTGGSGNSIVGDSLILSDETAREFLALFDPALAREDERAAVEAFFDRYAHQVSVLLHGGGRRWRREVEETLRREMPAHVQWRAYESEHPFVLGLSPLLGVDTFVEGAPKPQPVVLDESRLGRGDRLENAAALVPEAVNG